MYELIVESIQFSAARKPFNFNVVWNQAKANLLHRSLEEPIPLYQPDFAET